METSSPVSRNPLVEYFLEHCSILCGMCSVSTAWEEGLVPSFTLSFQSVEVKAGSVYSVKVEQILKHS